MAFAGPGSPAPHRSVVGVVLSQASLCAGRVGRRRSGSPGSLLARPAQREARRGFRLGAAVPGLLPLLRAGCDARVTAPWRPCHAECVTVHRESRSAEPDGRRRRSVELHLTGCTVVELAGLWRGRRRGLGRGVAWRGEIREEGGSSAAPKPGLAGRSWRRLFHRRQRRPAAAGARCSSSPGPKPPGSRRDQAGPAARKLAQGVRGRGPTEGEGPIARPNNGPAARQPLPRAQGQGGPDSCRWLLNIISFPSALSSPRALSSAQLRTARAAHTQ